MTDDLLVWLRGQLDEDERLARAASAGPWLDEIGDVRESDSSNWVANAGTADRAHIARWDPARVLREVEAKRRIIDGCEETLAAEDAWDAVLDGGTGEEFVLARFALQMLTFPYSDRPGYRQEWAP